MWGGIFTFESYRVGMERLQRGMITKTEIWNSGVGCEGGDGHLFLVFGKTAILPTFFFSDFFWAE